MQKFVIKGGRRLNGTISISGAKNASLPILAATILAKGRHTLHNVPYLNDICTMAELLNRLGMPVYVHTDSKFAKIKCISGSKDNISINSLEIDNTDTDDFEAPYDLVSTMRASILVLGPLLARRKKARVSLPGGCAIGARPVDLHISALEKMGAKIKVEHGYIEASCKRLHGAEITFKTVTVTGTENIMMAATLADGVTILHNAAMEPEVVDLANFLRSMGAKITGDGSSTITIEGVESLNSAEYTIMPDRIEAGTILCAVAGAGGKATVENAPVSSLAPVLEMLEAIGAKITKVDDNTLQIESNGKLKAADIDTMPHPGFPTDMQAQFMAILSTAEGTSIINENIFENRFMHVAELKRMGADITIKESAAVVKGVKELSGAPVMASDLRASASLVIAGLMASNTTEVQRIYHLDRGYESFEVKLSALGADVKRV